MLTDGTDVFLEQYGRLTNASQEGQQEKRHLVLRYLERVERTKSGKSSDYIP